MTFWQNVAISTISTWPAGARSARTPTRAFTDAALIVGFASLCIAAVEVLMLLEQEPPAHWAATLFPGVALVYVATGLVAWFRRPSSRLGFLIVAGGGAWFLAGMANLDSPILSAVGTVTQTLPLALIVHLLLGFPTGRLRSLAERITVVTGYAVCLILQAPQYLFAPGGPLSLADRPALVEAGLTTQRIAGGIVVLATAVLLIRRMRAASPEQRRVLAPLSVYGIAALLMVPVSSAIADRFLNGGGIALPVVQLAVLALVPVGFAIAASRGGFARTSDIAELGAWLGSDDVARPELRDALAKTLGDPSLQLLYSLPDDGTLVDGQGTVVSQPVPDSQRGVVDVELAGRQIGAIAYDAVLLDSPEEIREAGRVIALEVDRQRLIVELRASRSRIAAAADGERRRIARDLHDGLQASLVFLAIQAGTGTEPATIRAGIESAIDELRELVDGVMPVQLAERGLPAAVSDLADRLPTPVVLEVAGLERRLSPEVETAAYFVISEAIVNAVKHTSSRSLMVSLKRTDDQLRIEVADDGDGGVSAGRGVRGMADRVEALGGDLVVGSVPDGGTRVMAVIPCGS